MNITKYIAYIALVALAITTLNAQTNSGRNKKSSHTAWFACITPLPESFKNPLTIINGKKTIKLTLQNYAASKPVKIRSKGEFMITQPNQSSGGKPGIDFIKLAQVKIPKHIRKALVLLEPKISPEGTLSFSVDIQNLKSFKGGDRMYINLSKYKIRIKIGDERLIVNPKNSIVYPSPALSKPKTVAIRYDLFSPAKEKWKIITSSTTVIKPTRRRINVFQNGTRRGKVKKHYILFPVPRKITVKSPR